MIKAMALWKLLCDQLDYRFFSGVPCKGLSPLYNKMSSSFLHYVPAVNEQAAVDIVNGAMLAGTRAAVLMDASCIKNVDLSFNIDNDRPLLLVTSGESVPEVDNTFCLIEDLSYDIENCLSRMEDEIIVLFIKEGDLQ